MATLILAPKRPDKPAELLPTWEIPLPGPYIRILDICDVTIFLVLIYL